MSATLTTATVLVELIKTGTWTDDEDARLSLLVNHFNAQWVQIARFMPGRESKQCRERFSNIVDPRANNHLANWTDERDAELVALLKEHGPKLAEIVKLMPGMTYADVKSR
jgi:Myb-like DNA-binding domain